MKKNQSFPVSENDLQNILSIGSWNKIKSAVTKKLKADKIKLKKGQISIAIKERDGMGIYLEFAPDERNRTREVTVYITFKPQLTKANYTLVGE